MPERRSEVASPTRDARREQMYPVLAPQEIDRLRRFGSAQAFAPGEMLVRSGEAGHGMFLILAGEVEVTQQRDGETQLIVAHEPGAFLGELAQLSGKPALVDATARGSVEAIVITPDRLRALLVAEAELGERIMRALILRRVRLIEIAGGGPVIVGREGEANVLRLENYLSRNGHPHQLLDPQTDAEARALIERFAVSPEDERTCRRSGVLSREGAVGANADRTTSMLEFSTRSR